MGLAQKVLASAVFVLGYHICQFHQSECSFGKWMHCDRKTITFQLQNIFFSCGWFPCWPISCFAACTIAVTGLWSQANWPLVIIFICHYLSGEFSKASRKSTNFTLGLYHSLYEWFHPLYMKDVANNFTTQNYVKVEYNWSHS